MKKIILFFSFIIILSISINPVYGKNLPNDSILIISFKDKFGQTIKEDIILEGHINEEYRIKEYDIKGYTLKEKNIHIKKTKIKIIHILKLM